MAVTPDPVGAYNQSFQTADTSRRDYERLEMQRQQQAEAAVQRAREQKANDFKMMMEALGRRDDLKQQAIDNQFKKEQLANQTMTAEAAAYRARNPTSRSGQGMLNISPPGFAQPAIPGDGTTPSAVPPVGNINASGPPSYGAEGDLPMTDGQGNQPNLLLPQILPPTAASGTPPDLLPGELMPPPQAPTDNTPPAAPAVPPAVPAPTEPQYAAFPQPIGDLIPSTAPVAPSPTATPSAAAPTQPMPQMPAASTTAPAVSAPRRNDLMGYMLNRTDPYTDKIGIPRVAQMPEVPVFGQADIAAQGRAQLNDLARKQEQAQLIRLQAPRNSARAASLINSGKLNPERIPEWTAYIDGQDRLALDAARVDGEATQQLLQGKEAIKGTELRQGALNKLSNLNGVLPPEDRRQIYEEASDPRMAQLADQKIAVLTEYNALRQLKGITNASRGYSTAEKVVLAARELEKPEAIKDRNLVNNAEAYKAYIKANPEMDSKTKEKLDLDIAEAAAAKIRNEYAQTRFNKALEADMLKPEKAKDEVKPGDIRVNPVTGTVAAAPGIDRSRGRDILSNQQKVAQANQAAGNEYWGANTADVARQVFMDGGRDEKGNIVPPFSIALLEKIARGEAPANGATQGIGPYGAVYRNTGDEKYVDTLVKENLTNWKPTQGDPTKWGRQTQPTAQDFLKIAAQQRLEKIRADAANAATPQVSASGKAMAAKVLPAAEGN
jgi:hypothetical protein